MIDDSAEHVIVYAGFNGFRVYDCTLENAQRVLETHLSAVDPTVLAWANALKKERSERPLWVDDGLIRACFAQVLDKTPGKPSPDLRALLYGPRPAAAERGATVEQGDMRPEVHVTVEMTNELVLWAYQNNLDLQSLATLSARRLNELKPHLSLSFFAPLLARKPETAIEYADSDSWRSAKELFLLRHGEWKPDAKLSRVVARYLTFVQSELTRREERYEVAPREAAVG